MAELTPKQIVDELNKYIVGQHQAKRSVAIALRNRWRSKKLPPELQEEVIPKNILMIGPTGVGKTEIARRLAKLVNAPFIKVEATKFTEVGYVGRDVESMVRDLVETAIRMVKQERILVVNDKARELADEQIVNCFLPAEKESPRNPFEMLFMGSSQAEPKKQDSAADDAKDRSYWRALLKQGQLEDELIEITLEDNHTPVGMFAGSGMEEMGINLGDMLGSLLPKKTKKRKLTVANARQLLIQEEAQKLIDMEQVIATAIELAETSGIIFLDEIDKIAGRRGHASGPDVSREGVQRDILPIVEGSTVVTKYGPVKTNHVLFIAAGAFHISKPSELIPELQGRFPIRVELTSLSKEEFRQILTEPSQALIKQYTCLLAAEGIEITFSDGAIDEIAEIAYTINTETENIGARRLYTVMEKLLEQLSYEAPDCKQKQIRIDKRYVKTMLAHIVADQNLSQYIL